MSTVGQRICELRNRRGLTQEELGEAIGESKQTIYKYEKGIITNIPLPKVEAIARALRCPPVALTGWEEKTPEQAELERQLAEINALFDKMSPELRAQGIELLKVLARPSQARDDRGESD